MKVVKVAVIGPESSGKSILAATLGKHFNSPVVGDSCTYFLDRKEKINPKDLIEIAKHKIKIESETIALAQNLIISDNELLCLKIWAEYSFSGNLEVINELIKLVDLQYYDLYLLTKNEDVFPLLLRREDPKLRNYFFNSYKKELVENNLPFIIIEGDFYYRKKAAITAIEKLLR